MELPTHPGNQIFSAVRRLLMPSRFPATRFMLEADSLRWLSSLVRTLLLLIPEQVLRSGGIQVQMLWFPIWGCPQMFSMSVGDSRVSAAKPATAWPQLIPREPSHHGIRALRIP